MNLNNKKIVIDCLRKLKKEIKKRNVLYEHGVDLTNYENAYTEVAIELVCHLLGGYKEEVEWWLFENVKKIYYTKDDNGKNIEINVENANDFVDYIDTWLK